MNANPRKNAKKNKSFSLDFIAIAALIGILLLSLTFYFIKKNNESDKSLIPISAVALILGLIYEYKKICEKWHLVILNTIVSYVLSFLAFLPGKREQPYILENHIEAWPYVFCFIFIFICIIFYSKKSTQNLTEGITLLQSTAIIYYVLDIELINQNNIYVIVLMCVGILYSLISIFHAFSYSELTKKVRFNLSIWSSLIMAIFACDNIYRTFTGGQIETSQQFYQAVLIFGQYFLLGVSSIYIVQNFFMLFGFLPGKGSFFNKKYFNELKELKKEHISRYSSEQIKKSHALLCIIITSFFFFLNFKFNFMPRNTIIWLVFVLFPVIIHYFEKVKNKYS